MKYEKIYEILKWTKREDQALISISEINLYPDLIQFIPADAERLRLRLHICQLLTHIVVP